MLGSVYGQLWERLLNKSGDLLAHYQDVNANMGERSAKEYSMYGHSDTSAGNERDLESAT